MALTFLRLLLVPVFLALLISAGSTRGNTFAAHLAREHSRWAALALFAFMAATDKLDGYLARRLHQTSRLGTILDPAADKLLLAGSLILLCFPRFAPDGFVIPWPVTAGAYLKDIGVIIGAIVVLARAGKLEIRPSLPGRISTVAQFALVLATLLAPDFLRISTTFTAILLWCLWWAVVLAAATAAMDYAIAGARQLSRLRLSTPSC
jgi:cardiolipin synthase